MPCGKYTLYWTSGHAFQEQEGSYVCHQGYIGIYDHLYGTLYQTQTLATFTLRYRFAVWHYDISEQWTKQRFVPKTVAHVGTIRAPASASDNKGRIFALLHEPCTFGLVELHSSSSGARPPQTLLDTASLTYITMCRHTFAECAARLPPFERHLTSNDLGEATVQQLVSAGGDLEAIYGRVSRLTKDLPFLSKTNVCICKDKTGPECAYGEYRKDSAEDEEHASCTGCKQCVYDEEDVAEDVRPRGWSKRSPYKPDMDDAFPFWDSIIQLASNLITHPECLPFWLGLIKLNERKNQKGGRIAKHRRVIRVHPTRLLNNEDRTRTLNVLKSLRHDLRVHIVPECKQEMAGVGGYTTLFDPPTSHPD